MPDNVSGRVQGGDADGASATSSPVQIGGKDGSGNAQSLLTTTDGEAVVKDETFATPTYKTQSIGNSQEEVFAANASRIDGYVKNQGTTDVYIGWNSSVASGAAGDVANGGVRLKEDQGISLRGYVGAVHAITASGTAIIAAGEFT